MGSSQLIAIGSKVFCKSSKSDKMTTAIRQPGAFSELSIAEPIETYHLFATCAVDKHPQKVDLSAGGKIL